MMSSGEKKIARLLGEDGLDFVREKVFEDLRHGLYRFDFYLTARHVIIEVNGSQHYVYNSAFFKNKSDFTKAQERDRRKIAYCLANDIPIYIIPYWELDKIEKAEELFQEKFRAQSKFHNDDVWRQQIS